MQNPKVSRAGNKTFKQGSGVKVVCLPQRQRKKGQIIPMETKISTNEKTNRSEGKSETRKLSIGNGGKLNHRSICNGGKPNQILLIQSCSERIQRQRESLIIQWITSSIKGRIKTSGKLIQSFWENKRRKSTNPKQRRVLKNFGILGNCCNCNNWRLPGEPQISALTLPQYKTV